MMEEFLNHRELTIDSHSMSDSFIWFCEGVSTLVPRDLWTGNLSHSSSVLDEALVVSADGDQEQQALHVFEAVNPLLPL
jgi:hypothetical protein